MRPISFKRHRFPPEIIRHAIWLYARFTLSFRDVVATFNVFTHQRHLLRRPHFKELRAGSFHTWAGCIRYRMTPVARYSHRD